MTQTTPPPEPPRVRSQWVWLAVPGTLIALIVIAWILLSRAPSGKRQETLTRAAPPASEVIAEGSNGTATTSQIVTPGEPPEVVATTTATPPPIQVTQTSSPIPAPPTPTPATQMPAPVPAPPVAATAPPPPSAPPKREPQLGETEAEDAIRRYVTSRHYYDSTPECIEIANQGFSNRGYTIDVVDVCGGRGRLGRWRIDTLTREIFVQKSDGRFLRP